MSSTNTCLHFYNPLKTATYLNFKYFGFLKKKNFYIVYEIKNIYLYLNSVGLPNIL